MSQETCHACPERDQLQKEIKKLKSKIKTLKTKITQDDKQFTIIYMLGVADGRDIERREKLHNLRSEEIS